MNRLLIQIYSTSVAKYIKFRRRLNKNISCGRFQQFTRRKQSQVIGKIERLRKRVLQLQTQLRLAGAGAAIGLFVSTSQVQAQTTIGPFVRNYIDNPLPPPLPYLEDAAPAYVDLDGDGDLDLVVGDRNSSQLFYFKNIGSRTKPRFFEVKKDEVDFPFPTVAQSSFRDTPPVPTLTRYQWVPSFADVDNDGDYDLLLGTAKYSGPPASMVDGEIHFFKNEGTASSPNFVIDNDSSTDPFYGITSSERCSPTLADVDGDGDIDLILGGYYLTSGPNYLIQYYRNEKINPTDKNEPPKFVKQGSGHAFSVNNNLDDLYPSSAFADLDKDGDLDFFYSNNYSIGYRRNDNGIFTEQSGPWVPNVSNPGNSSGNPFDNINLVLPNNFTFADLDNDGDLDLTLNNIEDNPPPVELRKLFLYYRNNGQGVFEFVEGTQSPVDGVDMTSSANASFADIDGDGDVDAILSGNTIELLCPDGCYAIGKTYRSVFKNENNIYIDKTGTVEDKISTITTPPLTSVDFRVFDVNADGLLDLIVLNFDPDGFGDSYIRYFKNVAGEYVEQTGTNNPFDFASSLTGELDIDLGDLNNDGKLDLVLASSIPLVKLKTYENTGTSSNPVFTLNNEWDDGFTSNAIYPSPKLIDIDSDGDLDIIVGKYDGMWYYENTGTPSSPSFVERNGLSTNNPFLALNVGTFPRYTPSFNDFDNDGDLDLLAGDVIGQFQYFENTNPAPVTTLAATLNFSQQSGPIVLDASLTLSDSDGDLISSAIISIVNFKPGQEALSFTPQAGITGVFDTSTGVLTLSGRASISTYVSALRTVSYQFTGPTPTSSGRSGRTKAITLNRSITFAVLDQDRTQPVVKTLAVQVSFGNQPPVIADNNGSTQIGNTIELNFTSLITDPDDNLDAASLRVVQAPGSGASYVITGLNIKLDYTGTDFAGPDQFTIEVCDLAGACTQKVVNIQVEGEVVAYNGISPNGDGVNDFFELKNIVALEPSNKVSIYTRWGDKIFEVENYDNDLRKFVGLNNSGNQLTSGVYFYKVEFTSGRKELTGYLTIKR